MLAVLPRSGSPADLARDLALRRASVATGLSLAVVDTVRLEVVAALSPRGEHDFLGVAVDPLQHRVSVGHDGELSLWVLDGLQLP